MLQLNLKGIGHPRTGHEVQGGGGGGAEVWLYPSFTLGGSWGGLGWWVNATHRPLSPMKDQVLIVRVDG